MGKGSTRRREDRARVAANWELAFGPPKPVTTPGCAVEWGADCDNARFHRPPNPHYCEFFAEHGGRHVCGCGEVAP